mmetsp:Transcript_22391/g.35932  ORF Transcript_22391/g.35932 Transcript_22391/m.35932 type:complete len:281 (+) Transcript_22391:1253-2095(+)
MIADRRTTDGDHQVRALDQPQNGGQRGLRIARNGQNAGGCADALQQGGQPKGVGRDDLVRPGGLARHHQFVPGRDQGHHRFADHRNRGTVHRRQEGHIAGAKPARCVHHGALHKIDTCWANVVFGPRIVRDRDQAAAAGHVLLNDHLVSAVRDGRAGKNAHGLACANRSVPAVTCGGLAHDLELRVQIGLNALERIAVHGRGGKRGLRPFGGNRFCQNAPRRRAQRHGFAGQRVGKLKQMIKGLCDGDHVASKRPDFPPSFSTTRKPPISMPLSTALAMS